MDFIDGRCFAGCRNVRPAFTGILSGSLFSIGWWIAIDAAIMANVQGASVPVVFVDWLPAIFGTIGLILINLVDRSYLSGDDSFHDDQVAWKARLYIFFCFILALGSLAGAFAIMGVKYAVPHVVYPYFGAAIVIHNVFIFFSSMLMWGCRGRADNDI